jgi:DHA2 family multidrug resistance protein
MPDVSNILNIHTDAGRALLDMIVTEQATMIAYLNDFELLMFLTLAMVPMVMIIRASGPRGAPKPPEAAHVID